jgi:hypothetical protein
MESQHVVGDGRLVRRHRCDHRNGLDAGLDDTLLKNLKQSCANG